MTSQTSDSLVALKALLKEDESFAAQMRLTPTSSSAAQLASQHGIQELYGVIGEFL
ncbi:hypothetical protein [Synechococcus sp. UW179B]|uniref:hypothetical protein n=1 Tax=Synechococcus sp. UW179B TaxID=2575516 RepID=UPI001A7E09AE|nr:hypothetical protein [Synechococcus sp. UW179B]